MSETMYESEILKSLSKLDEILNKSQIASGGGNEPSGWEGGDTEVYGDGWDDDIEDDGTTGPTYKKGVKKAMSKDMLDEMMEEKAKVKAKANDDEEMEEDEEEEDTEKSISSGIEVSQFLNELTKSIASYCYHLEDFVEKSLAQLHAENGQMSKAIAENLVVFNGIIEKSQENLLQYSEEAARGPKSMLDLSKSVGVDTPEYSKEAVLSALTKGVEDGLVSPLEVIKCEQLGVQAVNQGLVKSLLA